MDLNSTRTAANTITPAEKPKTYGDTLHDFFVENRSQFEPSGITPEGLAQKAYETHGAASGKDYDTWSKDVGLGDFVPRTQSRLAELKAKDEWDAAKPEDRGFLAGTGAALGRGAMSVVGAVGQTMGLADLTPNAIDTDKGLLDRADEGLVKWSEDTKANTQFMRPTVAEETDANGAVKKAWEGGVESIVTSAAPMAAGFAGAKAGAAAGAAFGPVGMGIGGTIGGLGAYGLARFGMFGAGVYGDTYDKTYAELKQKNPGMGENEVRRIANKGAWTDAISENVSEAVGDAAAFYTFGGTKILQQPLKATIKDVMKRGIKGIAEDVAKQMPFEVGSEVANAAVGAQWRQEAGLDGGDMQAAMVDAIGPAVVMSLLMGGGVAGYTEVKARKALNDINAADPNVRAKTANDITAQILERTKDEELSRAWHKEAFARIEAGEPIKIDEKLAEFGANKARIDAVDNGEDVAVIPDESEIAEAAEVEAPLSPAETLLTDGVKTTPEAILLGEDDVVAPSTVSDSEIEASSPTVGTMQEEKAPEIKVGSFDANVPEQDLAAPSPATDADSPRAEIERRILELNDEINSLARGRGAGTKKRVAAMQQAKQEQRRLYDGLMLMDQGGQTVDTSAQVTPELPASPQAVGNIPVEQAQSVQAAATAADLEYAKNFDAELVSRRAEIVKAEAKARARVANLEKLGEKASPVQKQNLVTERRLLEDAQAELDAIDRAGASDMAAQAEARGVEEFAPASVGAQVEVKETPVPLNNAAPAERIETAPTVKESLSVESVQAETADPLQVLLAARDATPEQQAEDARRVDAEVAKTKDRVEASRKPIRDEIASLEKEMNAQAAEAAKWEGKQYKDNKTKVTVGDSGSMNDSPTTKTIGEINAGNRSKAIQAAHSAYNDAAKRKAALEEMLKGDQEFTGDVYRAVEDRLKDTDEPVQYEKLVKRQQREKAQSKPDQETTLPKSDAKVYADENAGGNNGREERTDRPVESGLGESDGTGVRTDVKRGDGEQDGRGLGGRRGTIQIPGGSESFTYQVVEASDLIPSHDPLNDFDKRDDYAFENERAYHKNDADRGKVIEHALDINPDLILSESPTAEYGGPVVDSNMNVLGGNSRAMTLQYAYAKNKQNSAKYRDALLKSADKFGIKQSDVAKMKRPVLVRVLDGEMTQERAKKLIPAFNEGFTQAVDPEALGVSRGAKISQETMDILAGGLEQYDTLRQFLDSSRLKPFIDALIADGALDKTRLTAVFRGGELTTEGKNEIERMIRGSLVSDYSLIESLPSSLVNALDKAIPSLVRLGSRGEGWDISKATILALRHVARFKNSNETSLNNYFRTKEMFGEIEGKNNRVVQILAHALENMGHAQFGLAAREYTKLAFAGQKGTGMLPGMGQILPTKDAALEKFRTDKTPEALFKQQEAKGATQGAQKQDVGDPSFAKRSKRTVDFSANPIVGPSGAKITGYEWRYRVEDVETKNGEDVVAKRVSDWSSADTNSETGRDIVHLFDVTMPNGDTKTASLETALKLLGFTSEADVSAEGKSIISAAKTVAKLRMEVAAQERTIDEYNAALKEVEALPRPVISNDEKWASMGGVRVRVTDGMTAERRQALEDSWTSSEMSNRGHSMSNPPMNKLRDLQARLKKVEQRLAKTDGQDAKTRNDGMRKATKAGSARVAEAKKAMAAIVNNPDIVGKDRADRIENARNLVNFLETNAANDLDTGYEQGDQVAYTGDNAPEGMRAFIYLEGAKAGKTGVAATKEAKDARATKAQDDWKRQQEEFRRLKEDAPKSDNNDAKRQMLADHIATRKANGEPVKQDLLNKLAELEGKIDDAKAKQGYVASATVYGHPEATNNEAHANLIPIIVKDGATIDRAIDRAQKEIDVLQRKLGEADAVVKGRIKTATKPQIKAAKEYLASTKSMEDETALEMLRTETMPELSRLAKLFPEEQAPKSDAEQAKDFARANLENARSAYKKWNEIREEHIKADRKERQEASRYIRNYVAENGADPEIKDVAGRFKMPEEEVDSMIRFEGITAWGIGGPARNGVKFAMGSESHSDKVRPVLGLVKSGELKGLLGEAKEKPVTGRTRWFVDYSETNKERTTEVKSFATLAEAREFAKGKSGYISKQEDTGNGYQTDKVVNAFKEYFGDFDPSAQEWQKMKAAFGEVPTVKRQEEKAEAPAKPQSILDRQADAINNARAGKVDLDQFKASFTEIVENEQAVKAELNALTKDQLLYMLPSMTAYRMKSEKKAAIVDAVYESGTRVFALGRSFGPSSYVLSGPNSTKKYEQARLNAIKELVANTTEEDIKAYSDQFKQDREELAAKVEERKEAIANPKTLDDFRSFISFQVKNESKSVEEARLMLTPEQRAEFDRLLSVESMSKRKGDKDAARTSVSAAGQQTGGEIIATKHTQKGHDLFVVRLEDRVSREDYMTLLSGAKKLGGYYSKFRGNGAIPGFQFTDREQAQAFLALAKGDTATAQETVKERRDAFEDDRSQTAAQRLTTMAERLEEQSEEILNADRKANTARRARQAASAEGHAHGLAALGKTMRNLAKALEEGTAQILSKVRQKTQVEMLSTDLRTAKYEELRAKYPAYVDMERHKGEPPTMETADYATFPTYTLYRSDWAELGRQLLEHDGFKTLGKRIMAVADDVSDAYLKFAKENRLRVSAFSKQGGGIAVYASKPEAERVIQRSGYRGRAIVLPFKRGENYIILSPSEAMKHGIWQGDGDTKITLKGDFVDELISKLGGRKAKRETGISIPWQLETTHTKRKALARMGIEAAYEYRAALREFLSLAVAPAKADKIKELERSMVGRANDGLDFFPTPQSIADEMVMVAEIEPGMSVLEPSAGMGHIAERIREAGVDPDVAEMSNGRRELLEAKGFYVVGGDFMDMNQRGFTYGDVFRDKDGVEGIMRGSGGMGSGRVGFIPLGKDERQMEWKDREDLEGVRKSGANSGYDRIIMNPPFSNRRDVEHVRRAYDLLKPGGRLVAIMGEGSFFGQDKKAQELRDWLDSVGGTSEKLPEGSFQDPTLPVNTGVNARMVVIEKDSNAQYQVVTTNQTTIQSIAQRQLDAYNAMEAAIDAPDGMDVDTWTQLSDDMDTARKELVAKLAEVGKPVVIPTGYGAMFVHPSSKPGIAWQATRLDKKGEPFGDTAYKSAAEAFRDVIGEASPQEVVDAFSGKTKQYATTTTPSPIDLRAAFPWADSIEEVNGKTVITKGKVSFSVEQVETISPNEVAFRASYGRNRNASEQIAGEFLPGTATIRLSKVADQWTVQHEYEHFLEDMGLITKFEQAVLDAAVRKAEKDGTLKFSPGTGKDRMKPAELRAYYVQHELAARDFQRKTTLGRVLQKVADFIDALANLFVRTSRGVVRDVASGAMMDREATTNGGESVVDTQYALAPTLQKAKQLTSDIMHRPEVFGRFKWINTQLHKALRQPAFKRIFDRFHAAAGTQSRSAARAAGLAKDILPDYSGNAAQTLKRLFSRTTDVTREDLRSVSKIMSMETLAGKTASPFAGHRLTEDELASLGRGETITLGGSDITMTAKQIDLYRQARSALDQMLGEMATSEAWKVMRGVLPDHLRGYWEVFANNPSEAQAAMEQMLATELNHAQARVTQAEQAAHVIAGSDDMDGFKKYGRLVKLLDGLIKGKDKFSPKQLENGDIDELIAKREEKIEKVADELGIDANDAEERLKEYKAALKEYDNATQHVLNVKDSQSKIADVFDKAGKLIKAGYAPLSRFGKYRIDVHNDEGNLIHATFYDSSTEAYKAQRKLVADFTDHPDGATVGEVTPVSQEDWTLYQGANPEALRLFAQNAGAESGEAIQAYYQDAVSSRSSLKHLINRKGYAGYSDDLQRILASFVTSGANRVSANYHAAELQDMVSDKELAPDLRDEAINLKKFIDNPGDAGSGFRAFAANWYMLGSMMSAVWNGTQVLSSTLPELYKHSGSVSGSAKDIGKAYKSIILKHADLTPSEKAALRKAMEDGTVDAAEIHHLYAQASKRFIASLGDGAVAEKAGAVLRLWGMPFAWFETINRKASFLAAYRMAEAQGMDVDEAYEFAKQIVDISQGIYMKHNRPNVARSTAGGAILTFMQYRIMTLEQITRNAKEGGQARKAAALQLAIIMAMGGWTALPLAEDIMDIFDAIMQVLGGKAWLTKKQLREAIEKGSKDAAGLLLEKQSADSVGKVMADFMNIGIVSTVLPVSTTARAGFGNVVPLVKLLKPSTQYRDSEVFEALGVPGSMAQSLVDASGMLLKGDVGIAAMRLAPNALSAVAKGVDILATGEIKNTRGKKITDGSPLDAAVQVIGGQPSRKAEINGRLRENQELKFLTAQTEKSIVSQWADAYEAKGVVAQREALVAVRKRIAEWNETNPNWPIVVKQSQVMNELKNRKKTTVQLASKSAPKELRRSMAVE